MRDQLSMFDPPTLPATTNATSSPESADGRTLSGLQDGPTTAPSGREAARASRSARRASALVQPTNGISGRSGPGSSASAALASSLESRLRRRLEGAGSTLFSLTWKGKATPARRSYCQLVASARRTSDSGCGSWPTPTAQQAGGTPEQFLDRKRRAIENGACMGVSLTDLNLTAQLAHWPTTTQTDAKASRSLGYGGQKFMTLTDAARRAWPTASARDWKSSASNKHGQNARPLNEVARLAAWSTPRANKCGFPDAHGSQECPLPGPMSTGSPFATGSPAS